jgi:hypothetical protein
MQLLDDGVHSDGETDDGEYAGSFAHTSEAGTYHFTFKATSFSRDGEPVTREAMRDKPVWDKLIDSGHVFRSDTDSEVIAVEVHLQYRSSNSELNPFIS